MRLIFVSVEKNRTKKISNVIKYVHTFSNAALVPTDEGGPHFEEQREILVELPLGVGKAAGTA